MRQPIQCQNCAAPFVSVASAAYCSEECRLEDRRARAREYGTYYREVFPEYMKQAWQARKLKYPLRVSEHNMRKRVARANAFVSEVDPDVIWQRDNGICRLCHQLIDPTLKWPNPMAKSLDHIRPISKGGTHEPSNVQLAHLKCNWSKGNRLIG